jgi:hypothetical protein
MKQGRANLACDVIRMLAHNSQYTHKHTVCVLDGGIFQWIRDHVHLSNLPHSLPFMKHVNG